MNISGFFISCLIGGAVGGIVGGVISIVVVCCIAINGSAFNDENDD